MPKTEANPVRLLIADGDATMLEMFERIISDLSDVTAATAPDLHTALSILDRDGPFDLVLVDLNLPGMDGVGGMGEAIERNGGHPVALLTGSPPPHVVADVLRIGGAGIVLKTTSPKGIANEIRFMAAGGRHIPVELIEKPRIARREPSAVPLSGREMTVLAHLAEGKANREIGQALGLAEATIKMHVKSICSKLKANNRTQAVVVARDIDLI